MIKIVKLMKQLNKYERYSIYEEKYLSENKNSNKLYVLLLI